MNYIGKFFSNFKDAYNEINAATLTGAIDAVVVRQQDGSYLSSPFHVRFGKIGVLRSREKVVDIEINGEAVDIRMKLGESGEAFFVEEIGEEEDVHPLLGTSPIPQFNDFPPQEDDIRSQDSGVGAEEVLSKSLKREKGNEPLVLSSSSHFQETSQVGCGSRGNEKFLEDGEPSGDPPSAPMAGGGEETYDLDQKEESVLQGVSHNASTTPSIDVPLNALSWKRSEFIRSKSLSTVELSLMQTKNILLDGQGSKTDVEENEKYLSRSTKRRRRKRTNVRRQSFKPTDGHSSENSTTSETADVGAFGGGGILPTSHEPIFLMDDIENTLEENNKCQLNEFFADNVGLRQVWASTRTMSHEFHPFSDTDLSPPPSRSNSRSHSPVKSDTEYECEKQKTELNEKSAEGQGDKWSWTWGELPSKTNVGPRHGLTDDSKGTEPGEQNSEQPVLSPKEDAQRSMLGSMFSFMKATRKARRNPENDGIYLDDLKLDELDPEMAALYFPTNSIMDKEPFTGFRAVAKDEDAESGNGTSLPQSPHSVEGAIGGSKVVDSDFEDSGLRHSIFDYKGFHDMAFSTCGCLPEHVDQPFPESIFLQSLITYDEFCENPHVIYNPNLVVRLDGKYLNWATAAPQILSLVLFQRPLPQKVIDNLVLQNMPKKEMRKRSSSKGYSWFSWGRYNEANAKPASPAKDKPGEGLSIGEQLEEADQNLVGQSQIDKEETADNRPLGRVDSLRHRSDSTGSEGSDYMNKAYPLMTRYKKTLRLSDEQIKKLNLKYGTNEVVFSVTTAYQGTTSCKCHVFLWNYDEKIVISDIDGTITKSDVLGHILPIIGRDWAQGGVAQLFTKIKNNGYNFLYLSARAIGQARVTRDYLRSIKQGDVSLPDGPLLLNPTSLIYAFHREVIERKPEEFKISCLRDIRALFPLDLNPFYAGYGNRVNDVWAYRAMGIPISRIFTINHKGELKHELTQAFQTTYSSLSDIAHHMFPLHEETLGEFSTFQYWRTPLPDLSDEIQSALKTMPKK